MAVTTSDNIKALLKIWYKPGVENLMFRNSPLLRKLNKVRVEGKQQNFCAMYGRGGAVSANFTTAKQNAQSSAKNVEFTVTPGQIFSVYTMNAKEVQASKTQGGAYMRVAGAKMFAASEGFRKTMAAALYGRGFGELCELAADVDTNIKTGTGTAIKLTADAIMKLDVGSWIEFKTNISDSSPKGTATVLAINGNMVTVAAQQSPITVAAKDKVCLAGCVDSDGSPMLPVGLDGWIPTVANRTTTTWDNFIKLPFMGVNRSVCADRLAGNFVLGAKSEEISDTLQALIMKCRRLGSQADMIIMNDEDFLTFSKEIQADSTFFTQTSTKEQRTLNTGASEFTAAFSTNYIENIIDDPYCPKDKAYVLDSSAVELWSYTNAEPGTDDGIAGNNPGKADPMTDDANGHENTAYNLIIDDYLNVQSGSGSKDGPDTEVSLMFYGSFVVTNPSVCGVAIFKASTTYIGHTA